MIPGNAAFEGALQRIDEIELLPREAAIGLGLAAEMAVGRGPHIDRLVEAEMGANAARREIEELLQDVRELVLVDLAGAGGVDIDRERLRDADRVGELDRAALGEPSGDDVLGEIARGIGGGAVDLGRVLAGEGAAAMRRGAAIGVDDDLAAGQPGIAVGTADDEAPGRIDVEVILVAHPALGQRRKDERADDLAHFGLLELGAVLRRDDDRGGAHRLAVDVLQADLALGVGAEERRLAGMAGIRQRLEDGMRVVNRRRHQLRRLGAGIAEHDALVAGALVLVAGGIDALRDIGRLLVNVAGDLRHVPVEAFLLVADILDRLARHLDQPVATDIAGSAHLAGEDDAIRRRQGLDAAARLRIGGEKGVDYGIGNAVANLVRMPLAHGLAGKNIIALGHKSILSLLAARLAQPRPGMAHPNCVLPPSSRERAIDYRLWTGARASARQWCRLVTSPCHRRQAIFVPRGRPAKAWLSRAPSIWRAPWRDRRDAA
jgi:hypothetical protein